MEQREIDLVRNQHFEWLFHHRGVKAELPGFNLEGVQRQ